MATITFDDFAAQGPEIEALRRQIEERRLVHAFLITGEPGTGKKTLASLLATALMCTADSGAPCMQCSGCRLALSGEHPDITVIQKGVPLSLETAKGRSTIPVDDIREMIRQCSQFSFEGGNRAVIIQDAENMTVQAQNCLLKILEEPPKNTFFLMTSAHPDQLLTTVRSRCRPVKLIPWDTQRIQDILTGAGTEPEKAEKAAAYSAGSIGNALKLARDDEYWRLREEVMNAFFRNRKRSEILALSTAWKDRKGDAETLFGILEYCIHHLLQYRLSQNSHDFPGEYPPEWQRFAAQAPVERFAALTDRIREARKQNTFNVNFQAIIEQMLLAFTGESDLWVK